MVTAKTVKRSTSEWHDNASKKRLAFILHHHTLYGATKSGLTLINFFQRFYDVIVIHPPSPALDVELAQIEHLPFDVSTWTHMYDPPKAFFRKMKYKLGTVRRVFNNFRRNIANTRKLIRLLNEKQVDIVYSNSSVIGLGFFSAWLTGRKHVWHIREFGQLDYRLFPDVWIKSLYKKILSRSDRIIFISESTRDFFNLPQAKSAVIYNGIDLRSVEKKTRFGHGKYRFAVVASFNPYKGQHIAVEAANILLSRGFSNFAIEFYGEGDKEYTRLIRDRVKTLGIGQNVIFHGFHRDAAEIFANTHCLLMCSSCEAFGRVTIEAMLSNTLVIGTNSCCTAEIIQHERNGLLFDGSPEDLAEKMMHAIVSPEMVEELVEVAKIDAEEQYSEKNYCNMVYNFIKDI